VVSNFFMEKVEVYLTGSLREGLYRVYNKINPTVYRTYLVVGETSYCDSVGMQQPDTTIRAYPYSWATPRDTAAGTKEAKCAISE
jgi:hypothetical protein